MLRAAFLFVFVKASTAAIHAHSVTTDKHQASQKQKDAVIQKVIDMLEENRANIKTDLQQEAKDMADYMEYCDDEQSEKGYAIKTATRQIGDLSALIEDRTAQITYLDEEVAKLGTELSERYTEVKEAEDLRKKESDEFKTEEKEMQLMIDELDKMEIEMKQQMQAMTTPPPVAEEVEASPEGAFLAALMQVTKGKARKAGPKDVDSGTLQAAMSRMVNAVWTDPQSKKALGVVKGFVQDGQTEEPADAADAATPVPTVEMPAEAMANFQESAANNLQAFETLKGKAQESLEKARNDELMAQHNHQLRMQSLHEAINIAEDKVGDYKQEKSRLGEEKGKAEGDEEEAKETKKADQMYLATLTLECGKTSKQWEARQKSAKEEMAAIAKAKEILSERVTVMMVQDKVDDGPDPAQVQNDGKVRQSLINHFRKLGTQLHSLAMLNLVSVASAEPLGQVKKLLSDLMAKLEKEAAEAASVHQFCKEEKVKTKAAKEKQVGVLDKVASRLDAAKAQQEALEDSVAELSQELAAIDEADKEATKIRNEEHATYKKVVADFKAAADAVEDALGALKDFYGDSSLVQTATIVASSRQPSPPKFGGSQAASGGGVISILETMQTEFMKTVATAESEEREAVKAYEKQINENKVSKATKTAESKSADSQIKSLAVSIRDLTEDHKMASKELDSVMEYIEKLKPQCEGRVTPYEERKARREAEIQGLKEALAIITSSSLLQIRNTFLHHF